MGNEVINIGKDCEDCRFATEITDDKGRLKIYCSARNRMYWYGQAVPCDDKEEAR